MDARRWRAPESTHYVFNELVERDHVSKTGSLFIKGVRSNNYL